MSTDLEFQPWPKIPRENPFNVTITEKIDGTNACIVIEDGKIVALQSRKRFITPKDDDYGFAAWAEENKFDLEQGLGDGHHYGEWAGEGIQKNPHCLKGKHLFLFNTHRWNENNPNLPFCCDVVPILYQGVMDSGTVDKLLVNLLDNSPEGVTAEGVVIYYHAFRKYTKHTIKSPNGKWCK